jgi:uncharacterized membrane protein YidH (DUF202 family)
LGLTAPVRDTGAARERTWLAWQRTAIVIAANGILLVRSANGFIVASAFAVLALAAIIGVWSSSSLATRLAKQRGAAFCERWMNTAMLGLAVAIAALDLAAVIATRD